MTDVFEPKRFHRLSEEDVHAFLREVCKWSCCGSCGSAEMPMAMTLYETEVSLNRTFERSKMELEWFSLLRLSPERSYMRVSPLILVCPNCGNLSSFARERIVHWALEKAND